MTHEWFLLWRKSAYIVLVLVVAGCSGRPPQTQSPPQTQRSTPSQECLSEQANSPCFYWRETPKRNEKIIIFVHGVFSSHSDTWGDLKLGNAWPVLVRGDDNFKDFDIYLVQYHTTYFTSTQMIHEIAIREMDRLKDSDKFKQYKEIYFVAHSMGGLVVKSLLTHLNRGNDVALLRRVKAVVYLGTPAQGADLADLGSLLSSNPQLRDMKPIHLNAWLSDVEKYWIQLMDDRKESPYPRAYCGYETVNYSLLGRPLVPQAAAASRCDDLPVGLPFDHSDLAVPTNRDLDPYLWVMDKINVTSRGVTNNIVKEESSDPVDKTIFIECERRHLPKTIPPDEIPKVSMIFPKPLEQTFYSTLGDLGNPGSVNIWWDPYKNGGYGHMCQLTNYGKVAVFKVVIIFGLRFKEAIADPAGSKVLKKGATMHSVGWPIPITKLAPGPTGAVSFYVLNTTPYYVEAFLPEFAELQRLGESKRRKETLLRQDEGPILMHIEPIKYPMTPPG